MKPFAVVITNKTRHDFSCIGDRKRRPWTDAFALQALVPALDLSVALGIVGGSPHMAYATDWDEPPKIRGNELGPIV